MARPVAVLLDVGRVLPPRSRAHRRGIGRPSPVPTALLDGAHYDGAARFAIDRDAEADWGRRLAGVPRGLRRPLRRAAELREEVHRHLDSEFADAALWFSEAPGWCRARRLAGAGVRLGIVSSADGMIGERLAQCQTSRSGPAGLRSTA